MTVMRALVAGLALLGAQPAIATVAAQTNGPRVVAAANGDVAPAKAGKASMKGAKSATPGKSKRSAPAIITSPNAGSSALTRNAAPLDSAKAPMPPAHRASHSKKH